MSWYSVSNAAWLFEENTYYRRDSIALHIVNSQIGIGSSSHCFDEASSMSFSTFATVIEENVTNGGASATLYDGGGAGRCQFANIFNVSEENSTNSSADRVWEMLILVFPVIKLRVRHICLGVRPSFSTFFLRKADFLPQVSILQHQQLCLIYVETHLELINRCDSVIYRCILSLKCCASCMATIDDVDKGWPRILYRVNGSLLHPGISGTTMTTTHASPTSTAIRRAWFSGTSLPRRAIRRRGRHVASELSHWVGQVEFLFLRPRCWQSRAP